MIDLNYLNICLYYVSININIIKLTFTMSFTMYKIRKILIKSLK